MCRHHLILNLIHCIFGIFSRSRQDKIIPTFNIEIKQDLEGYECINRDEDEIFNPKKLKIKISGQVLMHTRGGQNVMI